MAKIIEESEAQNGERIATVQTDHGEILINVDKAIMAVADAQTDMDHETRMGWSLNTPYYVDAFKRILSVSVHKN